jgi:hypothetical protein
MMNESSALATANTNGSSVITNSNKFGVGPHGEITIQAFPETLTQEERLQRRVEFWQKRLGLVEWTFWSEFRPTETDSHASVSYDPYHFQGTILLNAELAEDQWDWTIVHELLEVMLEPAKGFVDEVLLQTDSRERAVLDARTDNVFEPLMNRLAQAVIGLPRPKLPR